MLLLAIDTATPAVTAGVVSLENGRATVLAERVTVDGRAHGELITPHLLDAAGEAGIALGDVEAIVCGSGPGPYTGLRAGMVTAATLGHALDVPAYPVCSLHAIAAEVTADEPFVVITDARRREVYWAAYASGTLARDGERLDNRVRKGPYVQRPGELSTECGLAAGHGAELYAETVRLEVIDPMYPGARGLVLAAGADVLAGAEPAPLTPLYLRLPHAAEPGARKRVSA